MKKIILSSLVILGLTGAAFAQDAAMPDFVTLDLDASGGLSLAEVQAALPDTTQEQFTAVDVDANGELSTEEFVVLTTPAE